MFFGRTIVVTKYLLIEVTEKMKRFNGNIGAFQSAFYQTPKVFESVRVNLSVNVFLRMVNDAMSVFLIQSPIGVTIISRELRAEFDVIFYKCVQSVTLSIFKNLSSYFPATFQDSA